MNYFTNPSCFWLFNIGVNVLNTYYQSLAEYCQLLWSASIVLGLVLGSFVIMLDRRHLSVRG